MQLGEGRFKDQEILSSTTVLETHLPQIVLQLRVSIRNCFTTVMRLVGV